MSFPIEHPAVFLTLCGVLALNAWRIYKANQFIGRIQQECQVIQFPERET